MGIKELTPFLKNKAPGSIKIVNLNELKGKIAIDISIFLYKFKYKTNNLITKFLDQINRLHLNNIEPIYVFDGIPPEEKKETINSRKEKIIDNNNKLSIIIDDIKKYKDQYETSNDENIKTHLSSLDEQKRKLEQKMIRITKEDINNVKYFFDMLNVKYIQAEGEADLVCSYLCKHDMVDMVMSEDMDILTSGAKILIRDFQVSNNKITKIDLNIILTTLNMSYEKWVEFCIMCGCDYIKRIPGLGPKISYKYLTEYPDKNINEIIDIIKNTKQLNIPENYFVNFKKAKDIFMIYNMPDINNIKNLVERNNTLFGNQRDNIRSYLLKYTSLTERKIDNRINNIFRV